MPETVIPAVKYIDATQPTVQTTTPVTTVTPASVTTNPNPISVPQLSPMAATQTETGVGMAPNTVETLGNYQLNDLIQLFVPVAFIIAAALSAVFIFIGGMSFILSGGNEEKIKKAVNTIRYSIVGLIITILSFTFVMIVGRFFGLNFLAYLNFTKIKTEINRMVQNTDTGTTQQFNLPPRN